MSHLQYTASWSVSGPAGHNWRPVFLRHDLIALIAGDERREGDTMRNAKAYQKQMGDLNKNNGWLVVDLPL